MCLDEYIWGYTAGSGAPGTAPGRSPSETAKRRLKVIQWHQEHGGRGKVTAKAKVTKSSPKGVVFMTFHFAESATNLLTNPALDPVSKIPELKFCAVRVEKVVEKVPA